MPVLRRRSVVQPARGGIRLRVPPAISDIGTTLRRASPITFAPGRGGGFGDITPISETADKFGRHLVVEAKSEERLRCPPGYLAITLPDGSRACALAGPAIAAGLARRRQKPLISVKETRALQLAGRAQKKIDNVHKRFGTKPRMRRRSSK